jgi:hypothetical protein
MGRTNSPRYEAFTTTRYYPTMTGRNLTFAPSQYGDAAASGAVGAPGGAAATGAAEGTGGSLFSSIGTVVGAVGTELLGYKLGQDSLDRQAKRDRDDKLAEARVQTEQAKAQMIAGSIRGADEGSVWPWVIGGTVLLAGIAVGGYLLTRN